MKTISIAEVKSGDVILNPDGELIEIAKHEIDIDFEDEHESMFIYHYGVKDTADRVFIAHNDKDGNHMIVRRLDSTVELHHRPTIGELYWRKKYGLI